MHIETIDAATYVIERAKCDKAAAYAESVMCEGGSKRQRNYLTADEATHPDYAACSNAMRGRVEQFEILRDLPETIFAYMRLPGGQRDFATNYRQCQPHEVVTWTGDILGRAFETARWRVPNSFVSTHMHQYRATIGGREYTGRGPGVGMYVRLKETAASKRRRNA